MRFLRQGTNDNLAPEKRQVCALALASLTPPASSFNMDSVSEIDSVALAPALA